MYTQAQSHIHWRGSIVWPNARAWRARVPQGTVGSNPTLSAKAIGVIQQLDGPDLTFHPLRVTMRAVVLDGELAVPCTRNPL
jgi:hypothetical protein